MGDSKVGMAQNGIDLGLKMTRIARAICWYHPFVGAIKNGSAINESLLQTPNREDICKMVLRGKVM